jgi:hypothetical protein
MPPLFDRRVYVIRVECMDPFNAGYLMEGFPYVVLEPLIGIIDCSTGSRPPNDCGQRLDYVMEVAFTFPHAFLDFLVVIYVQQHTIRTEQASFFIPERVGPQMEPTIHAIGAAKPERWSI